MPPSASRDVQPADDAVAVTPSDITAFPEATRGIYTGSGGDIAVQMVSGRIALFAGTPAGGVLPVQVTHVRATGTVATSLVALF